MTELTAACTDYFRQHPAFDRILRCVLQKYQSYGRAAGTITLPDAAPEECAAARSLFGRPFSPPLCIKTAEFEAALQKTRFQGVVLREVLELYFSTSIRTKKELKNQTDANLLQVFRETEEAVQSELCRRWLGELSLRRSGEYALIRKAFLKNANIARRAVLQACQGIDCLESRSGERLRLAVLSAYATSDPHALDASSLAGRLFLHLLALRAGTGFPDSAEKRDSLCYDCGILCDSISSCVTQIGLRLFAGGEEHPACREYRLLNEPATLSLTNLARLTKADSPSGKAYLVENQMVFTQLCDRAASFHSPLICTSGQPAVAAIRLLDLLAASGTELFYSGDFDGKGLSIAAQLMTRYPGRLRLWHLSEADYARCRSEVELSGDSRALLEGCAGTRLAGAAQTVARAGRVGYQELLLPELDADLTEKQTF